MVMMIDLRRLRILYELNHRGTLAAVADALAYTPAAISQQLSKLQSEVGAPLVERDGRYLRLTPQANILVRHTRSILEKLEQAESEVADSLGSVDGTVRVGCLQTGMLALIPNAISSLREQFPAVRIEVTQAEPDVAASGLLSREFDVIIVEVYPGYPELEDLHLDSSVVLHDPMRLAVSPQMPDPRPSSLGDLQHHPWVMEPLGTPARQWAVDRCHDAGFEPDVVFESDDMLAHARLVESGLAVAFLPDLMSFNGNTSLHYLPPPAGVVHRQIRINTRKERANHPALRAFKEAINHAAGGSAATPTHPAS